MPDLASLPSESHVFVDTNIFYYHFQAKSVTCTAFFNRIASDEVVAYVNSEVLSDLMHKLMLAEAVSKGLIPRPAASLLKKYLAANRLSLASMSDHQAQFENTLAIGLRVLRVTKRLLVDTKAERVAHDLMATDSLHLGNMNRHRLPIRDIATNDEDFSRIPSVRAWEPFDVIP